MSYKTNQWCKRDVEVRDRDETETFGFQSEMRPRPRPSRFSRDRDRDRDVRFWVRDETETETLKGRDRDIFRDLGMLSLIGTILNIFASHMFSKLNLESSRKVKFADLCLYVWRNKLITGIVQQRVVCNPQQNQMPSKLSVQCSDFGYSDLFTDMHSKA